MHTDSSDLVPAFGTRAPDVVEKLNAQTLEPMFMTVDQFAQRIRSDYDKYGKVIKLTGAGVD